MAYRVQDKLPDLTELCRRYHVQKLVLFGSALRDDFDPQTSDLDFLVEFQSLAAGQYVKTYFGFLQELESLFGRSIDLVEEGTIRNPYLLRALEAEQEILYAA
jgi:predicted nucleotidyltransferase